MTPTARRYEARKQPVQARAHETRARILDAAARIFAVHGYAAGTTNRIAAEAGLSVGSLYQYFPNKDAVLVALVRGHVAAGLEVLASLLDPADPPPSTAELLARVVDATVELHRHDPALHQVLFEEAPRPPALLAELHAAAEALVATVAGLLARADDVHVADATVAARMAITTVESVVHRSVATREPAVTAEVVRDELVRMLSAYLGLPPAPTGGEAPSTSVAGSAR